MRTTHDYILFFAGSMSQAICAICLDAWRRRRR